MKKTYLSLGLMSGTSGDGVDASIIESDGKDAFKVILNKYFEFDINLYKEIHALKEKINSKLDLLKNNKTILELEKKITIFHSNIANDLKKKNNFDLIGFHGQTIYHNPLEMISKQIGSGLMLSQSSEKKVIYNFRQNDIKNGGEGAPLTPIFHHLIYKKKKLKDKICILNIGGISNITVIFSNDLYDFESCDIGPGNCLIDEWIRKNSGGKYDKDGQVAKRGQCNEIILEQALELFANRPNQTKLSLDTKDFDVSFVRGLSLQDGAATLTEFTSHIISSSINKILDKKNITQCKVLLCGGGRKNSTLIKSIRNKVKKNFFFQNIDELDLNGDFIESQAFAYLAIRSILKLPISFPQTTGSFKPVTGGKLINFSN